MTTFALRLISMMSVILLFVCVPFSVGAVVITENDSTDYFLSSDDNPNDFTEDVLPAYDASDEKQQLFEVIAPDPIEPIDEDELPTVNRFTREESDLAQTGDTATYQSGIFSYTLKNNAATITKCDLTDCDEVTIPSTLDGYPVAAIGSYLFYNYNRLKSVTIENGVASIGVSAFAGCTLLSKVTFGSSITQIGWGAFEGCTGLTKIEYTGSLEDWCHIAFSNEYSNPVYYAHKLYLDNQLVADLKIPDTITAIGDYAFIGCSSLKNISIPCSVTEIGSYAFTNINLDSLTIPGYIKKKGSCFIFNFTVKHLIFSEGSIAVYSDMVLSRSTLESVFIPLGVLFIQTDAFRDCNLLKKLTIPDTITSDIREVFDNCSITDLSFSDGSVSVNYFSIPCRNTLESVTIPDSMTEFAADTFLNCTNLSRVNYTGTIEDWCAIHFQSANANPLYVAQDLYIDDRLVTDVCFSDSVTSVGDYAFIDCTRLENVYYYGTPKEWMKINFGTIESNPLYYAHHLYINDKLVTELDVSEGVSSIENYAFAGCTDISSVTISDAVTEVGDEAFSGCQVKELIVADGTKRVSPQLIVSEHSLESVFVPDSVIQIDAGAFSGCSSLIEMSLPFGGRCRGTEASLNHMKTRLPFGEIFGKKKYDGCIYVGQNTSDNIQIAFCLPATLKRVTITDSPYIPYESFMNCEGLTDIVISEHTKGIGYYAFSGCSGLVNLTIPFVGRERINEDDPNQTIYPFGYIFGSKQYTGGIATAQKYKSNNNYWKETYYIPATLKTVTLIECPKISFEAFINCSTLQFVTSDVFLCEIEDRAFYNCSELTAIAVPPSVSTIGNYALGYYDDNQKIASFTIFGYKRTEAERYARNNQFRFVPLNGDYTYLGDVDGDEDITITDATCIFRQLTGIALPFTFINQVADVDQNSTVDIVDATLLQKHLADLNTETEIGQTMD